MSLFFGAEGRKKKTKGFFFNASVFQASNLFPVTPLSFQFFNYAWFVFGSPGGLETAKIFELERNEEAGTKASKVRLSDFEAEGNLFLFPIFFDFLIRRLAFSAPRGAWKRDYNFEIGKK